MLSSSKKSQPIVYRTDFEKHVINSTCDRRGFVRYRSDTEEAHDEWNIYWASVHSVRCLFNPETGRRLHDGQLINHFPNHYELTRKDLMIKNIKRFRKEVEKRWQLSTLRDPTLSTRRFSYSGGSRLGGGQMLNATGGGGEGGPVKQSSVGRDSAGGAVGWGMGANPSSGGDFMAESPGGAGGEPRWLTGALDVGMDEDDVMEGYGAASLGDAGVGDPAAVGDAGLVYAVTKRLSW